MNHHYIDYMLRERRKQEMEECKRMMMLRAVCDPGARTLKTIILSVMKSLYAFGKRTVNGREVIADPLLTEDSSCIAD